MIIELHQHSRTKKWRAVIYDDGGLDKLYLTTQYGMTDERALTRVILWLATRKEMELIKETRRRRSNV